MWDNLYKENRDYTWLSTASLAMLCKYAEAAPETALDIGCGTGQLARDLYHRGYDVTGVDTSHQAVDIAERSSVRAGIKFLQHDVCQAPLAQASFGLITCKYTVAFIARRGEFFKNISKMLAPGGKFIIITPRAETLPASKKSIAVEHSELFTELQKVFTVEYESHGNDIWYICG